VKIEMQAAGEDPAAFSVAVFLPISCNGEVPVTATGQKAETEGDTGD